MAERIIKVSNKTENFTISANEVPRRADLSARAKGIHSYLMTLPADWKLYREELYTHFTEGRDAINTAFKELEEKGYIKKTRLKEIMVKYLSSIIKQSTFRIFYNILKTHFFKFCTSN